MFDQITQDAFSRKYGIKISNKITKFKLDGLDVFWAMRSIGRRISMSDMVSWGDVARELKMRESCK